MHPWAPNFQNTAKKLLRSLPFAALAAMACIAGWFVSCRNSSSESLDAAQQNLGTVLNVNQADQENVEAGAGGSAGIVYQSLEQRTWRLAHLFAGRAPTEQETQEVAAEGLAAMSRLAARWVREPAFGERMEDIFNDRIHVSAARESSGIAVNRLLSLGDFPKREWHLDTTLPRLDAVSGRTNIACNEYGFTAAPLRRIRHVAQTGAPASEIFLGETIWVNQCSARALGIEDRLTWPAKGDSELFLPFDVSAFRKAEPTAALARLRFSGLLTDFGFLHRYPYTIGNAHRSRADILLKTFLGVDVSKLPLPPADERPFSQTPTLDDDRCMSCHKLLDPVANLFHNFSQRETAFRPRAPLAELWPRGFLGQAFTEAQADNLEPLQWLGNRMKETPAFYESLVALVWQGLTGHAFSQGNEARVLIAARWRSEGASLQKLAVMLAELPEFHARDAFGPAAARLNSQSFAPQQLVDVPQLGDRLIHALQLGPSEAAVLRADLGGFNVPLGGIDHFQVTTKLKDPSPIWAASMQVVAARWSCVFAHTLAAATKIPEPASQPSTALQDVLLGMYRTTFAEHLAGLYTRAVGRPPSPEDTAALQDLFAEGVAQAAAANPGEALGGGTACEAKVPAAQTALNREQSALKSGLVAATLYILLQDGVALR